MTKSFVRGRLAVIASTALSLIILDASNASAQSRRDQRDARNIGEIYRQGPPYPTATRCVNGYRLTHIVPSGGRVSGGVLVKCRG